MWNKWKMWKYRSFLFFFLFQYDFLSALGKPYWSMLVKLEYIYIQIYIYIYIYIQFSRDLVTRYILIWKFSGMSGTWKLWFLTSSQAMSMVLNADHTLCSRARMFLPCSWRSSGLKYSIDVPNAFFQFITKST